MTEIFRPADSFCEKCDRPLAFRKLPTGKWCPCEPDGSDHFDICRETQVKLGRCKSQKTHDFDPDVHTTYPNHKEPLYSGEAPPWE